MEQWEDQGIILGARRHGENGAIVSLLTPERGRCAGYMRGAFSGKNRGTLEVGNIVDAHWQTRVEGSLGTLTLELVRGSAARVMDDALKLAALQSACALCDAALPEGEGHPGLYQGFMALLDVLESDVWGEAYVMWEIALLRELGFSLDLSKCAGGGRTEDLAYVSPKTGRAVSEEMGAPYKEKLLALPLFLRPPPLDPPRRRGREENANLVGDGGGDSEAQDILIGLTLTGYFLQHWVFAHHSSGIPEARQRLHLRFAERFEKTDGPASSPRQHDSAA